jgi:hypothetical protein
LEHLLAQSVENKVNSPISLDTGIYSAIAGGRFVGPSLETPRLASNADDIMRLIGVSAVLNHQVCGQYWVSLKLIWLNC